ncbi:MAG: hypothetical protein ACREDJ_00090 [Methylocella sp.]
MAGFPFDPGPHAPRPRLASGRRLTIAGRPTTVTGQTQSIFARKKDAGLDRSTLTNKSSYKAQDIWEYPRGNRIGRGVWDSREAILEACCDVMNTLMAKSGHITSMKPELGEGQNLGRLALKRVPVK